MAGNGVCVFGGSFNPPHLSHRRIARAAVTALDPARLLVVPCGDHPLKATADLAPASDRLAMCRIAFADLDRVEISELEVERDGPSFTVETVRLLRAQLGLDDPLYVLIGSDNLAQLDRWHEHAALFELATVVTFPRRGHPITERALRGVRIRFAYKRHLLDHALRGVAEDAVSSTDVRARLRAGRPVPELAPEVAAYIRAHGLYGAARQAP